MAEVTNADMAALPPFDPSPLPLTVTHVLEHLFCPRFTYFEYVLGDCGAPGRPSAGCRWAG